jgi:hypothetical protein
MGRRYLEPSGTWHDQVPGTIRYLAQSGTWHDLVPGTIWYLVPGIHIYIYTYIYIYIYPYIYIHIYIYPRYIYIYMFFPLCLHVKIDADQEETEADVGPSRIPEGVKQVHRSFQGLLLPHTILPTSTPRLPNIYMCILIQVAIDNFVYI